MCNRCNCAPRYAYLNVPKRWKNDSRAVLFTYGYFLTMSERMFLEDLSVYTHLSYKQHLAVNRILGKAQRRACVRGY